MTIETHKDLEIIKFGVAVAGKDEVFVPVNGAEKIEFKIPESSKYVLTMYFKVKNKAAKNFNYKQTLKRHGITVRTRQIEIGDYEPSDEIYVKLFPEDETPGGFLMRGLYPATSVYYTNGEELMTIDWSLEILKK